MNQFLTKNRERLTQNVLGPCMKTNNIFCLITVAILLVAGYYFIRLPILSLSDADLWYHLNGGRYFFQHKEIPHNGFFSFIAASREWSNYYWLFQVLVFGIYSLSGYFGLILFKAAIYMVTVLTIARLLLKDEKNEKLVLYFAILSILYCFGLIPRYFALLRPHMISYLLIPLYLYLLESRSRGLIALPILTIFWANFHGIEYPVIILMGVCYLFEFFLERLKSKRPLNKQNLYYVIPIVLSMWSILLNPYGFELLDTPFGLAKYQDQYIKELGHIRLDDLLSIKLYPFGDLMGTAFNVLLMIAWLGCIKGVWRKNIRISHLMLIAGGLILLSQAERFRYEAVLLALPVLKANPIISRASAMEKLSNLTRVFTAILLFSLSIVILDKLFEPEGKYPFSYTHLPRGVVTFLNHIGVGGSVLNNPLYGGYLQWALNPKYKIFMDLQMVLFTAEDYFLVTNAFYHKEVLTNFLEQYKPAFILNERTNRKFKSLIKSFPEYRVVFFDNVETLYVNNKIHPQVATQYELTRMDPYTIMQVDIAGLSKERTDALLEELLVMNAIYPEGSLINLQIGRIYKKKGDLAKALFHADILIENYPELPVGYQLKGDILMKRKMFGQAISFYTKAFDRGQSLLGENLSFAYAKIGQHEKAYHFKRKTVSLFSPSTSYRELYDLANKALRIGKAKEASMLLTFAYYKTPHEETKLIEEIRRRLDSLQTYLVVEAKKKK